MNRPSELLKLMLPPFAGYIMPIYSSHELACQYDLLRQEEELIPQIQDDNRKFSKQEITNIIALVQMLASLGRETKLVSLDEMIDVLQIYLTINPIMAKILTDHYRHGQDKPFKGRIAIPNQTTSKINLNDLTQSLNDQEMYDAWTARVAAALAQLSTNC